MLSRTYPDLSKSKELCRLFHLEKTSINEATRLFSVSRTTLYSYLKKLKIKPKKQGNRSHLTNKQILEIKTFLDSDNLSEQLKKLEQKLEKKEKEIKRLEIQQGNNQIEAKKMETENIQLTTRAEVLDEQNKKIIFQMGATAEKMAMITLENKKLIEITGKSGIFKRFFSFWKK